MRSCVDPLGRILLRSKALTEDALADVLDAQRRTLPFASLCYVLGHVEEETLVRCLCRQAGMPGVVLDRSVIQLSVFQGLSRAEAFRHVVLPLHEDERHLFVAVERAGAGRDLFRQLEFMRGKAVLPHLALHVTLARTIRACYRAIEQGLSTLAGPLAPSASGEGETGVVLVTEPHAIPSDEPAARAHSVVVEDITKEVVDEDLLASIDGGETGDTVEAQGLLGDDSGETYTTNVVCRDDDDTLGSGTQTIDEAAGATPLPPAPLGPVRSPETGFRFDSGPAGTARPDPTGPPRLLLVDDDFATRHLLVKVLQPAGYVTTTAASGSEAVRAIKTEPPDLVILDVMLPVIDGFQICRAIKQSKSYRHIPVILMSAVIDSGRVTDSVLKQYGADAYFDKPLDTDRLTRRIEELLRTAEGAAQADPGLEENFARSLELYRNGDINGAVSHLRVGIEHDPLSAKHHFVLANLLQRKSLIYEAIDEYEATVDLKPDYFPALTRLAYLYYKQGFSAKAIETWRRSLPYCPEFALRQNIEIFMRKLIADMQSEK